MSAPDFDSLDACVQEYARVSYQLKEHNAKAQIIRKQLKALDEQVRQVLADEGISHLYLQPTQTDQYGDPGILSLKEEITRSSVFNRNGLHQGLIDALPRFFPEWTEAKSKEMAENIADTLWKNREQKSRTVLKRTYEQKTSMKRVVKSEDELTSNKRVRKNPLPPVPPQHDDLQQYAIMQELV